MPAALGQWALDRARLGPGGRYLAHDLAEARRLLAEAGFPNGLRARCVTWPGHGPDHGEALGWLVADLRQAGIELAVADED